jgi:hypothetical protein
MPNINKTPRAGTKGFMLTVVPTRTALEDAIGENGFCHPKKCWHRMALYSIMQGLDPNGNHHIRVDAGHIKLNYKGYHYVADTPLHVKRSLMLFDAQRYDEVRIRAYNLRFRRTTKVRSPTRERQDQVNEARRERRAQGIPARTYNLRARVAGFSGVV